MHALSHTLAHRGPGASRTRTRWQPYSSTIASSSTPSRSPATYLNTPASSVSSSPASTSCLNPSCNLERPRKTPAISQSCQIIGQSREAQKNRYVSRLVDQAVNSLCDIWHPDDIPTVFRTSSRTAFSAPTTGDASALQPNAVPSLQTPFFQHTRNNTQLPSPVSPSTQASPFCPAPTVSNPALRNGLPDANCSRSSQLLPLKGFVHEVLRRSRTSTGVLQTALCYLEAVRGKIPELLRKENSKTAADPEEECADRIVIADCLDFETFSPAMTGSNSSVNMDFAIPHIVSQQEPMTAPPSYAPSTMSSSSPCATSTSKQPSPPLPPLPPLPSPLLCPRRTFLACLILASKFMQDRSYSNRAWAKLAGLPPREISRCERALGQALEWRLWVGKSAPMGAASNSGATRKPVARSRSEADLAFGTPSSFGKGLRRSATVPTLGSSSGSRQEQDGFFVSSSSLPFIVVEEPELLPTYSISDVGASSAMYPPHTAVGSATELIRDRDELSPPLSTPTLYYSPMSTVSSSSSDDGDRTIQMTSFLDLPTPLSGQASFTSFLGQYDNANAVFGGFKPVAAKRSSGPFSSTTDFMVMDTARMPPMVDPAVTPHGSFNLPPLSEALGSFDAHNMMYPKQVGYGVPQLQDTMLSYWMGISSAR